MTIQIFPKGQSNDNNSSSGLSKLPTTNNNGSTVNAKATTESDYNTYVRTNGWSRPRHYFQTTGWACFGLFAALNLVLLVPNLKLSPCTAPLVLALNLTLVVLHITFNLVATSINPIDDQVLATRTQLRPAKFDRTKHEHVIENQFCYICESLVGAKSKHCSLCNKCVADFDHHCKWLNNCVGGKNYL